LNAVAQLIQKIANLSSKFRPDDVFSAFNEFLESSQHAMMSFVDEISKLPNELPKPKIGLQLNSLIAYDAACMIHYLNQHTDYYDKNKEEADVIQLLGILEPINKLRSSKNRNRNNLSRESEKGEDTKRKSKKS